MANLLNKNTNGMPTTQRGNLETRYNSSVTNLLLVVGFSLINIVLLVMNSDTYFLFSAFIPYVLADFGMFYCGMYPEEYYYDVPDMEYLSSSFLVVTLAVAAVILLLYFLSWLFAKKKKVGWLIFALIFFCIDTVAMLLFTGFAVDSIVDIIFHAWVIVSLSIGVSNYFKLKKLPEEELDELAEGLPDSTEQIVENSSILRMADTEVKSRTLLEAEAFGHHIVYRRVKKVNELVVDGRVYDEYEALVEYPHTLCAVVGGHKFEVQYDNTSHMYIFADGQQIAKKLRIF